MNKLQQGDYVTDLTEEQFDELMDLQPPAFLKYMYHKSIKIGLDENVAGYKFLGIPNIIVTQLTFEEFRERAINTFGDE